MSVPAESPPNLRMRTYEETARPWCRKLPHRTVEMVVCRNVEEDRPIARPRMTGIFSFSLCGAWCGEEAARLWGIMYKLRGLECRVRWSIYKTDRIGRFLHGGSVAQVTPRGKEKESIPASLVLVIGLSSQAFRQTTISMVPCGSFFCQGLILLRQGLIPKPLTSP